MDYQLPRADTRQAIDWNRYASVTQELKQLHKKNEEIKAKLYAGQNQFGDQGTTRP